MGAKMYSGAVDMWSVGVIFAELMMRVPYFAAETDIGQLDMICRALGTPTEAMWPVQYLFLCMYVISIPHHIFNAGNGAFAGICKV